MEYFFPLGGYLLFLIGMFALFHYFHEPQFISLPVIFNALAFLYFFLGILLRSLIYLPYASLLLELSIYAVIAFNFGYIVFRNYESAGRSLLITKSQLISTHFLWAILVMAILLEGYVILSVGFESFFLISRHDRFPILKEFQPLLYLANASTIVAPLAMVGYFVLGDRKSKILFYAAFIHNLVFALLTVSRSGMLECFIALVYVMEAFGKIRKINILALGVLIVGSLFVVRGVLYVLLLNDYSFMYVNPGEIVNWIRNSEVLLDHQITGADLPENSYLLAFKSLFVISPKGDAPAEWFVKTFDSSNAVSGFTRGFSGLLEGYLYLKHVGVAIHFFIIGVLFALLQNGKKLIAFILVLFCCYASFRLFRSEAYNFVKYIQWYYIIPLSSIFILDRILKRAYARAPSELRSANAPTNSMGQ